MMMRCVFLLAVTLFLAGCGDSGSSNNQAQQQRTVLDQYAAGSGNASKAAPAPQQNASGQQPQPAASQPAVEQSSQPAPVAPPANKIYTYQGNVLLPPNAYMDNPNNQVDKIDVCGVLSPTQTNSQKYCYKFSELSNRLYDATHSGLDVWDVQGDWYLLLTKTNANGGVFTVTTPEPPRELWVEKSKFGVYHPYADIMQQKLLFLGDWDYKVQPEWPLQAYDGPGGNVIELKKENYPNMKSRNPMVAITAVAQSDKKELWFKLNIINSLCENRMQDPAAQSPVIMDVWYPAYRLDGNMRIPTVWFSAKGC